MSIERIPECFEQHAGKRGIATNPSLSLLIVCEISCRRRRLTTITLSNKWSEVCEQTATFLEQAYSHAQLSELVKKWATKQIGQPRLGSLQPPALRDAVPFCRHEPALFTWIKDALLDEHDDYFHLADFASYVEEQARADQAFCDRSRWLGPS